MSRRCCGKRFYYYSCFLTLTARVRLSLLTTFWRISENPRSNIRPHQYSRNHHLHTLVCTCMYNFRLCSVSKVVKYQQKNFETETVSRHEASSLHRCVSELSHSFIFRHCSTPVDSSATKPGTHFEFFDQRLFFKNLQVKTKLTCKATNSIFANAILITELLAALIYVFTLCITILGIWHISDNFVPLIARGTVALISDSSSVVDANGLIRTWLW